MGLHTAVVWARLARQRQFDAVQRCGGRVCPPGTCSHRARPTSRPSTPAREHLAVPSSVLEVIRRPGSQLDTDLRADMEARLGHDFGRVRVHRDQEAATSVVELGARAYTVGSHVVFGPSAYRPTSDEGRELLVHELVHVVQQEGTTRGIMRVVNPSEPSETEAELIASAYRHERDAPSTGPRPTPSGVRVAKQAPAVMRQALPARPPGVTSPCPPVRLAVASDARAAGSIRVFIARNRLLGLGPSPPAGLELYDPVRARQLEAEALARRILRVDASRLDWVRDILDRMLTYLSSSRLAIDCASPNDPVCSLRAAYVVGHRPPVHLCSRFFSAPEERRIQTMVHEAAHLAGIGQPDGESYCGRFDCETECFDSSVADTWSFFVHCASGQPSEQPVEIMPRPRGGARPRQGPREGGRR